MSTPLPSVLHLLHSHVSSGPQSFSVGSSSVSPGTPPEWPSTADQIRAMRVALTNIYAAVLNQEEKEQAKKWGWTPQGQRFLTDRSSSSSDPNDSPELLSDTLHATSVSTSPSSSSPSSSSNFHRFNLPIISFVRDFRTAGLTLSQTTLYHHALINTAQSAGSMLKSVPHNHPAHQMQPVARAYLMHLKQRLEIQRQQARLAKAFQNVHHGIQSELQERKRRQVNRLTLHQPMKGIDGHYQIPPCDLFALSSSLAYIRSELHLTNGADDPTTSHTFQPAGSFTISNQTTIDGRELPPITPLDDQVAMDAAKATRVASNQLAFEKHNINLSSTGATTCFVLDLNLVRPIISSPADSVALDSLLAASLSLPGGLAYLHPLSGLGQILSEGFGIFGTLTIMFGEDSVVEQPIDTPMIRAIYHHHFEAIRQKVALLLEYEQMREQFSDEKLQTHRERVVELFERLAATSMQSSSPSTSPSYFLHNLFRTDSRVEGPALLFGASGMSHRIVPIAARDSHIGIWSNEEYDIAFVGVEQVDRTSISVEHNAMNLSNPPTMPSSTTKFFAYRFLLSCPLCLPFDLAQSLFRSDFYASYGDPTPVTGLAVSPLDERSYHVVCLESPVKDLIDDDGNMRLHARQANDTVQRYRATHDQMTQARDTIRSPTVRITSLLIRDLAALPNMLQVFRQVYTFQRLYRSCFDTSAPVKHSASSSMTNGSIAPSAAPVVVSAPPATGRPGPTKLKFSYRDLLDDQPMPPSSSTSTSSNGIATIGSSFDSSIIEVIAHPPHKIQLRTIHPITRNELAIQIQVLSATSSSPSSSVNDGIMFDVSISCGVGRIPSNRFARTLLETTGSIPIMMERIIQKCS